MKGMFPGVLHICCLGISWWLLRLSLQDHCPPNQRIRQRRKAVITEITVSENCHHRSTHSPPYIPWSHGFTTEPDQHPGQSPPLSFTDFHSGPVAFRRTFSLFLKGRIHLPKRRASHFECLPMGADIPWPLIHLISLNFKLFE